MIALTEVTPVLPWCGDLRDAAEPGSRTFSLRCRERAGELLLLPSGRIGTWWDRDLRWWTGATPETVVAKLGEKCGCS